METSVTLRASIAERLEQRIALKEKLSQKETDITNLEDSLLREKKSKKKREHQDKLEALRASTRRITRDLANVNNKLVDLFLFHYRIDHPRQVMETTISGNPEPRTSLQAKTTTSESRTLLSRAKPFRSYTASRPSQNALPGRPAETKVLKTFHSEPNVLRDANDNLGGDVLQQTAVDQNERKDNISVTTSGMPTPAQQIQNLMQSQKQFEPPLPPRLPSKPPPRRDAVVAAEAPD